MTNWEQSTKVDNVSLLTIRNEKKPLFITKQRAIKWNTGFCCSLHVYFNVPIDIHLLDQATLKIEKKLQINAQTEKCCSSSTTVNRATNNSANRKKKPNEQNLVFLKL